MSIHSALLVSLALTLLAGCSSQQASLARLDLDAARAGQSKLAAGLPDAALLPSPLRKEIADIDQALTQGAVGLTAGESAMPWSKDALLRRVRAELLDARIRTEVVRENLAADRLRKQAEGLAAEQARLVSELAQVAPGQEELGTVGKGAVAPASADVPALLRKDWDGIASAGTDIGEIKPRIEDGLQQLTGSIAARQALELEVQASFVRIDTLAKRMVNVHERKLGLEKQRAQSLNDSLVAQKSALVEKQKKMQAQARDLQDRLDAMVRKCTDKEFMKDQVGIQFSLVQDSLQACRDNTQGMRAIADTAIQGAMQCQASQGEWMKRMQTVETAFTAVAQTGLDNLRFADGSYTISPERTNLLDKSFEMLAWFWPGTRIDVVQWGDTTAFMAESTLVADLAGRRGAYVQSRIQVAVADTAHQRFEVHQCFRQLPPVAAPSFADSLPHVATPVVPAMETTRHYPNELSLVLTRNGKPLFANDTNDVSPCLDAEQVFLARGATVKRVEVTPLQPTDTMAAETPSEATGKKRNGKK